MNDHEKMAEDLSKECRKLVGQIIIKHDHAIIEQLHSEVGAYKAKIATLEEWLEDLKAQLQERVWISVEDRLPDDFGWFLVIDDCLAGTDKQTMGFFEGDNSPRCSHIRWIPLDQRGDPDSMKITHWMGLPEAPQ